MNEEKDLSEGEELRIIPASAMARKAKEDEARRYWESLSPDVKMNPPFDAQEATRCIVRVMHDQERFGCGFVVANRYVITAAHCLPRIPISHLDQVLTTIKLWDGSDEASLVVIYCDIFSDIAILASETFYGDQLSEERFWAFIQLLTRTGSAHIDLSFPLERLQPFYIRTHEGVLLTGLTESCGFHGPCFDAVVHEGDIPGGTSGSPVFNQKGEVMGLASLRGETATANLVTCPWLAGALPSWYIRELDEWQKEQEVTDEIN